MEDPKEARKIVPYVILESKYKYQLNTGGKPTERHAALNGYSQDKTYVSTTPLPEVLETTHQVSSK
jgi:hypothetical protein